MCPQSNQTKKQLKTIITNTDEKTDTDKKDTKRKTDTGRKPNTDKKTLCVPLVNFVPAMAETAISELSW